MERTTFEELVAEGFERLPQWVQEKVRNVAVIVEDQPSPEVRKHEGLTDDETLLGYYQGIPLSERGEGYGVGGTMPDIIYIYMKPTLEMAEEEGLDVRDIVADTVWHEFAHHFGMDEKEVRDRERAKNKPTTSG